MVKPSTSVAGRYCKREYDETDADYLRRSLQHLPHGAMYEGPFHLPIGAFADYLLVKGYLLLYSSGYWAPEEQR